MAEVHGCPVCGGNGLVPRGFYLQATGSWGDTGTASETCQSCQGQGYVVIVDKTPLDEESWLDMGWRKGWLGVSDG